MQTCRVTKKNGVIVSNAVGWLNMLLGFSFLMVGNVYAIDAPIVDPVPCIVEANYTNGSLGGKNITVTGSGQAGAQVTVIVRVAGQRYDQPSVTVGSDGRFSAQAGIFGFQNQGFLVNAFQFSAGNYSPESPQQGLALQLRVPAPVVDPLPSMIEAFYTDGDYGGAFVQITGTAVPSALVTPLVHRVGQCELEFPQNPVMAGSDGKYIATIGLFGWQNQPYTVNAFAKINDDISSRSNAQPTSVHLLVPTPSLDSISFCCPKITGSSVPGSQVTAVLRDSLGNRQDLPPVIAGPDGRYVIGTTTSEICDKRVSVFAKIGGDFSSESASQLMASCGNLCPAVVCP